ncbi:FRG domain-containing protein [uncultured Photobacterium sp.]|uniref:FRG domain-containing protein n=1 Tax=uncultured Photobacterium sp. TaxID=173973 RepID=UPI0026139713|nr:FRG domain-containing protein [uncultured Photobacterium sp.]
MDYMTLKDPDSLHRIFRTYRSLKGFGSWFRGQADEKWALLPSAGREDYYLPSNRDLGRFREWSNYAIAHERLPENIIEALALAQHHGLSTRLLDWSKNPLVACYFCVISEIESDGAIYILEPPNAMAKKRLTLEEIEDYDGVISYIPAAFTSRVLNQQGLFTIHCPANREIEILQSKFTPEEHNIKKIIVPSHMKAEIKLMLDDYGINESTMFPGLDGLSKYINGDTKSMVKRKKSN